MAFAKICDNTTAALLFMLHHAPMYRHLSDLELAATFRRQPDNGIIGELYKRYRREVYRYGVYCNYRYCQNALNREVLEDFTTDVFVRLFQQLQQYDINQNFKSWLMRSAHNLFIDMMKQEMRYTLTDNLPDMEKKWYQEVENEAYDRLLHIQTPIDNTPEAIISALNHRQIDINAFIARAIEKIANHEQKTCLYHFYIEQCSYKDIAQITDFDLKKVKSALQHGKRTLQNTIIALIKQLDNI